MKLPIPQDWDGESWECFQIQWPKSQLYRGVLLGLLSYLTRGRTWDENTGTVTDALAVGWQIWAKNYPLVPCEECADCPDCEDCPDCGGAGGAGATGSDGGSSESEDDDLGQVVTDVQIVDGKLRVFFGPCCWHDLALDASMVAPEDDLGEDPLNPDGEEPDPNTYSACAKAWAIVDAIEAVMNAAYDVIELDIAVWLWPGKVETAVDMNLNDKWTVALIIDWAAWGLIVTPENAFTDEDQQKSVAALVNVLSSDSTGVPDDAAYEEIKNAIHTRGLVYDGLIMTAIAALGRKNLDTIVKLAAGTAETRSCGEPIINPDDYLGSLIWRNNPESTTRNDGTFTPLGRTNNGLTYEWKWVSNSGSFKALTFIHNFDRELGATFTELTVALEPVTPTDELLHINWDASGCSNLNENADTFSSLAPTSGATITKKWDNGRFYIKWTHATPQTALSWTTGEARNCPSDSSNPGKTYQWKGHIVSVNGVDTGVVPNTTWP